MVRRKKKSYFRAKAKIVALCFDNVNTGFFITIEYESTATNTGSWQIQWQTFLSSWRDSWK